jgi:thiosulfate/3-mercaptopyruvate sulfurtransferase
VTADELAKRIAAGGVTVLDVRSRREFTGEAGYPCDPQQGHIGGAVHLEWSDLYAGEGRPHGAETIRALLAERGVEPDQPIVAYCHSGQRSELAAVALRSAGLEADNYEGSWHEWSRRQREFTGAGPRGPHRARERRS